MLLEGLELLLRDLLPPLSSCPAMLQKSLLIFFWFSAEAFLVIAVLWDWKHPEILFNLLEVSQHLQEG